MGCSHENKGSVLMLRPWWLCVRKWKSCKLHSVQVMAPLTKTVNLRNDNRENTQHVLIRGHSTLSDLTFSIGWDNGDMQCTLCPSIFYLITNATRLPLFLFQHSPYVSPISPDQNQITQNPLKHHDPQTSMHSSPTHSSPSVDP